MSSLDATPGLAGRLRGDDRRTKRRKIVNKLMVVLSWLAALLAVAVLAVVMISVLLRGIKAINWGFFSKVTPPAGLGVQGGVLNAIIGTLIIIAIATAIAVPIGVLVALYTNEYADRKTAQLVRLALDVLNGVPSIVIGIFVFALLINGGGRQAAWIAGFALSIIEIPLIARSSQEVLYLVPATLRDASAALGARRWKTIVRVVLPAALGGIVTGTTLAIARVAGETAPILFLSSIFANKVDADITKPLATLPYTIFVYSESPDPHDHDLAWAAALLLMLFVLVMSFTARVFLSRTRKKLEGGGGGSTGGIARLLLGRVTTPMRSRSGDEPQTEMDREPTEYEDPLGESSP